MNDSTDTQALAAVRALHRPATITGRSGACALGDCEHEDNDCPDVDFDLCAECDRLVRETTHWEVDDLYPEDLLYPCPTMRALEVAQGTSSPRPLWEELASVLALALSAPGLLVAHRTLSLRAAVDRERALVAVWGLTGDRDKALAHIDAWERLAGHQGATRRDGRQHAEVAAALGVITTTQVPTEHELRTVGKHLLSTLTSTRIDWAVRDDA